MLRDATNKSRRTSHGRMLAETNARPRGLKRAGSFTGKIVIEVQRLRSDIESGEKYKFKKWPVVRSIAVDVVKGKQMGRGMMRAK